MENLDDLWGKIWERIRENYGKEKAYQTKPSTIVESEVGKLSFAEIKELMKQFDCPLNNLLDKISIFMGIKVKAEKPKKEVQND